MNASQFKNPPSEFGGLRYARGSTATPKGIVSVDWKLKGDALMVSIAAPKGVTIGFKPNASHEGWK